MTFKTLKQKHVEKHIFEIFDNFMACIRLLPPGTRSLKYQIMKAKWGAFVVDGRGKVGGHVASKNKAGAYFRTKVSPVNPQSTSQITVRNRMATRSQAWRGLDAADRDAWNAAVASFPRTNVFGDSVEPSGFNLYCELNNNLLLAGESAIDTPPTPDSVDDIVIGALSAGAAGGTVSLAYTAGAGGSQILVFATAPQSPGRSFVKSQYRYIGQFASDAASPFNAATAYITKFGAITTAAGQKIFFKTKAVNTTTGQSGVPQSASAIIAA